MNVFLRPLLFVLSLLMAGQTVFSQTWIPFDASKNKAPNYTVSIIESNVNSHRARIKIHGIHDREISEAGESYHQISITGGGSVRTVGEPQLPTISQLIAIPEGATYKVSVSEVKWQDIEIGRVYPAQESVPENAPAPQFQVKESIYAQEGYMKPLVSIGEEQSWRHIRNVAVTVCPFKYYPAQGKLSVLTEYVLNINFEHVSDKSHVRESSVANAMSWKMFGNDISTFPVEKKTAKNASRSSGDYDMLIVVGNLPSIINSQAMSDFRKWKAFKGYKTKVVSTSTIGTSANDIKYYIYWEYYNHDISYVLLVGDHDQIPLSWGSIQDGPSVEGDYWYGCLDDMSIYQACVPVGRFPTNTLSEFQNMVDKTIDYERSYDGNCKKTLLVAHKEDAPGKYQACSESIRTSYSSQLQFTTAYGASTSLGGNNATNAQVLNHINGGMHIVNYRGHGESTHWGIHQEPYPIFGWNNTNELFEGTQVSNIIARSIYFNVSCMTGYIPYDNGPCFLESLMRSQNGAIACLGATFNVDTEPNDNFNYMLFKKLLSDGVCHFGDLIVQAHIEDLALSDAYNLLKYRLIAYGYICGGDPTLEMWTDTPSTYNNVSLAEADNAITIISPSFGSSDVVCIVSEDGEIISKVSMTGSQLTFQKPSGNFYVVVNRHNYYPYIVYYNTTSHYIQNKTIDVDCVFEATPLSVGYDVTNTIPYGKVQVKSGNKLEIRNGSGGVLIKNRFECEKGAQLVIE